MTQEPPSGPTPPAVSPQHAPSPGAVLEPDAIPEDVYHLVLLDDDHHSYAYVIEMLGTIFGYGREKAYTLASLVDHDGRVIVETADHGRVTRHQGQIHSYGPDPRIAHSQGSMSAVVEAAGPPP